MREILFKGKRADNGEWVYGVPTKDTRGETVIIESVFECEEYNCRGANCLYVDENTIGQYTGLTDKNGTKIFEGDIVEGLDFTAEEGGYGVVTFDDGAFEIVGSCDNNIVGTFYENYYGKDFEIIGNIHDNPELLKGE